MPWGCWVGDDGHTWFFTAEMTPGQRILWVGHHGEDGLIRESGKWSADVDETWERM